MLENHYTQVVWGVFCGALLSTQKSDQPTSIGERKECNENREAKRKGSLCLLIMESNVVISNQYNQFCVGGVPEHPVEATHVVLPVLQRRQHRHGWSRFYFRPFRGKTPVNRISVCISTSLIWNLWYSVKQNENIFLWYFSDGCSFTVRTFSTLLHCKDTAVNPPQRPLKQAMNHLQMPNIYSCDWGL